MYCTHGPIYLILWCLLDDDTLHQGPLGSPCSSSFHFFWCGDEGLGVSVSKIHFLTCSKSAHSFIPCIRSCPRLPFFVWPIRSSPTSQIPARTDSVSTHHEGQAFFDYLHEPVPVWLGPYPYRHQVFLQHFSKAQRGVCWRPATCEAIYGNWNRGEWYANHLSSLVTSYSQIRLAPCAKITFSGHDFVSAYADRSPPPPPLFGLSFFLICSNSHLCVWSGSQPAWIHVWSQAKRCIILL